MHRRNVNGNIVPAEILTIQMPTHTIPCKPVMGKLWRARSPHAARWVYLCGSQTFWHGCVILYCPRRSRIRDYLCIWINNVLNEAIMRLRGSAARQRL